MTKVHHHTLTGNATTHASPVRPPPAPPAVPFDTPSFRLKTHAREPRDITADPFANWYFVDFSTVGASEIIFGLYSATLFFFVLMLLTCVICCIPERIRRAVTGATVVCGLASIVATLILTDRMEAAVIHARHLVHKSSRIYELIVAPIEEVH